MIRATIFLSLVVMLLLGDSSGFGQTYDAQFVVMLNDGVNFDVKVQIKANGLTFALGKFDIWFSYDGASLNHPTIRFAHNFWTGNYGGMGFGSVGGSCLIYTELNTPGTGETVTTSYMDVATIRFTVTNPAGESNLRWNGGASKVYKDDMTSVVGAGTLNDLNTTPLPVQLTSFTAGMSEAVGQVVLKWCTTSETNNYGFTVQRKGEGDPDFADLAGAFIAGKGTTVEPQTYNYVDKSIGKAGQYSYRLKQQDLDGTVFCNQSVIVNIAVTDVAELMPRVLQLHQNYPNPFNPSTTIRYGLPSRSHVRLTVFNSLGQQVSILQNGEQDSGYHEVRFDGASLPSGVYFYRMQAGSYVETKRLLLLR